MVKLERIRMMTMSPQEKFSWASLGLALVSLGYYVVMVLRLPEGIGEMAEGVVQIFLGVIVLFIILQIIITVLLLWHLKAQELQKDERDILIELKSTRNAHVITFGSNFMDRK